MQFFKSIFALSALASISLASNTVTFVNQDGTDRSVVFTPGSGLSAIKTLQIGGYGTKSVTFPTSWQGMFWAFSTEEGQPSKSGILGELTFNSWDDLTWFDVSAIDNPSDTNNVKEIFPKNSNEPVAGCQDMPCTTSEAYYVPDDNLATKSTTETELVCLLGTMESPRRRGEVARNNAAEKTERVAPTEPLEQ